MSEKFDKLANCLLEFRKITLEGAKSTDNRKDFSFMGANLSFMAIVPIPDGASFHVWSLDSTSTKIGNGLKHKLESHCMTLDFDPFYPTRLMAGCDSGKFTQWHLDMSLTVETAQPVASYEYCSSSPVQTLFHPTAGDVAFLVNAKKISCVNLKTASLIRDHPSDKDIVGASINFDGTRIVCAYSDCTFGILSTVDFSVLYVAKVDNSKKSSVVYLTGLEGDYYAVSTIVNGLRSVKIFEADLTGKYTESKPHTSEVSSFSTDNSQSFKKWNMIYDPDTNLIILFTGGESIVNFMHLSETGKLLEQGIFRWNSQQVSEIKGLIAGPKLSANPVDKELLRMYKATSSCVEVYSLKHPRKAHTFERTLYPPTFSNIPAITVEEFIEGKVSKPGRIDLEEIFNNYKQNQNLGRTYSLAQGGSNDRLATSPISLGSQSSLSHGSSNGEFEKKIEALTLRVEQLEMSNEDIRKQLKTLQTAAS